MTRSKDLTKPLARVDRVIIVRVEAYLYRFRFYKRSKSGEDGDTKRTSIINLTFSYLKETTNEAYLWISSSRASQLCMSSPKQFKATSKSFPTATRLKSQDRLLIQTIASFQLLVGVAIDSSGCMLSQQGRNRPKRSKTCAKKLPSGSRISSLSNRWMAGPSIG